MSRKPAYMEIPCPCPHGRHGTHWVRQGSSAHKASLPQEEGAVLLGEQPEINLRERLPAAEDFKVRETL